MDAMVTAGGIPQPDEPLYEFTRGNSKAMLDVAGKPMVQWVLDALSNSKLIERVLLIGLGPENGLTCTKPLSFLPNQGGMLDNIKAGMAKVLELNPTSHHTLIVSSDIPGITGEMVDWVINAAMQTDDDGYYNVITREVMEARFPGSRRSYGHFKDIEVTGGDMNVFRTMTTTGRDDIWEALIGTRKNVLKQAALIGFDTLFLLLIRQITLEEGIKRVCKRLNLKGRAIICPYAEVGMDVDKPFQLEIMRADLSRAKIAA
jgi:GTP:adenosylcobinamide-phosphate guanylyltransferase